MKIIQGELYNMFASFKMDDLITLGSNLEKYYAIGMEEKRISQRMVEKQLDKYLSSTGELQAVEIENDWFPTVNADVFLSHSHKDEKQIIALAGELRSEYGLRSFIDSGKKCLSPAKKYKLYKSSINKSLHFAQRSLSSSTRG